VGLAVKLTVLTYNIHRAIGLDRRFRPERVVEVLDHYRADVVLLQEVDEGAPRSRQLDLARTIAEEAGYPHVAVGHNVALRKGRYGNATLSRLPILRERNIDLTVLGKKRRGCQHTTLWLETTAGDRALDVFNLHLGLSARERERQVGLLVGSREFSDLEDDQLCLVAGDFNDWRTRLRVAFCEVLGFGCATDLGDTASPRSLRTYPSPSPRGGLDKIYFRGPLAPVRVQTSRLRVCRVASDHLPVIVEFRVAL
jgi:endonuclease/exonuclease/phosphatase family metal-dependent hydrolase